MHTFILILSLISDHGGVAINQIEFNGPNSEMLCNEAGIQWRTQTRDFSTTAKYICVKK
ncbi:hypothetical protein CkP1_0031 [Citrobacter phage CkP1]|nr:hypothetical protein CkP1_0031 [Citrobacter phage CkP1]